jgi:catechol 2,3-dioxygenase-like lactoylglutathione lyase family enzyme
MSIFHNVALRVTDFERLRDFYAAVLGTLGVQLLAEFEDSGRVRHAGFGIGQPAFWIASDKLTLGDAHIAFNARSRAEVEAFHTVALSVGGRSVSPPGLRRHYHPELFAAVVLDPDGNDIEAVLAERGETDERL